MKPHRWMILASCLVLAARPGFADDDDEPKAPAAKVEAKAPDGPFLVKPYLQLGHNPEPDKLVLQWHADDVDADWSVAYKTGANASWGEADKPKPRPVAVPTVEAHRVYHVPLKGLEPGGTFAYKVSRDGKVVFESDGHAPKSAGQAHRFVAFGDCGAGTPEERAIVYRTFMTKPDYVMITGDIVYGEGQITEYRDKYWPIFNADEASPGTGAPLIRSTLTVASPGNHDIANRDLAKLPDGLAYFYYWNQPLNGPTGPEGGKLVAPVTGPEANKKAFLEAAGKTFPKMANFLFDYGNTHWTILDANASVDWSDPELRDWVARDLAAAKGATWRFVNFHQPGFNSSRKHFDEQYMRLLAPIFEAGQVDLVFNGHVHNYQRSYPLRFVPKPADAAAPPVVDGKPVKVRRVDGKFTLDKTFDGQADTTPEGVIYLVTGAGGQHLYNPEQQDDPGSWQEFTLKHLSKTHSLTVADVDGSKLTIRQVTPDGEEIDRFTIAK